MAIAVVGTRNNMAGQYGTQAGTWIGLATADPGTSATPSSEVTGGSPAYARKQTTWAAAASSATVGSAVTIDSPAATVTYILVASASTGNNMADKASVTSVTLSGQGTIVVTPTFTIS